MPAETQWVGSKGFTNAGSQAAAAVAAPSAIATPPNEGLYGEYQAHALDAYNRAKINIQQKRSGIFRANGFNEQGGVDGLNSTGAYQQMKHNQALELQGAENQAQERHLGGHGLGAQVANAPRFQEDADSAAWEQNFLAMLDGNSQELSGAEGNYQQALIDARRAQIEDDIANARYSTPDPGSNPDPSAPGPRATTAAARIAATKMPTATTRVTARSTEKAPAKKPIVYGGRH